MGDVVPHVERRFVRRRIWSQLRRGALAFAAVCVLALCGAGAWAGYLQATGNIHEVAPGLVYRSNQLGPVQMVALLHDEGIRTVINLRGGSRDDPWYREEADVVASVGARLIDIPLLDSLEPDAAQMTQLLDALGSSPTPILIHCKAGADRSGLAAALAGVGVLAWRALRLRPSPPIDQDKSGTPALRP